MIACPSCGVELPADAAFCGACGHRLAPPAPAPAPRQAGGTLLMGHALLEPRTGRTLLMPSALAGLSPEQATAAISAALGDGEGEEEAQPAGPPEPPFAEEAIPAAPAPPSRRPAVDPAVTARHAAPTAMRPVATLPPEPRPPKRLLLAAPVLLLVVGAGTALVLSRRSVPGEPAAPPPPSRAVPGAPAAPARAPADEVEPTPAREPGSPSPLERPAAHRSHGSRHGRTHATDPAPDPPAPTAPVAAAPPAAPATPPVAPPATQPATQPIAQPAPAPEELPAAASSPADGVRQVVRAHPQDVSACYDATFPPGGPGPDARVELNFLVASDGRPGFIKIVGNSSGSPRLGTCLVETVAKWRFPIATSGDLGVTHTFVFRRR